MDNANNTDTIIDADNININLSFFLSIIGSTFVCKGITIFSDSPTVAAANLSQLFDRKPDGGYYDGTDLFHNNNDLLWSNETGFKDTYGVDISSKSKKFRPNSISIRRYD